MLNVLNLKIYRKLVILAVLSIGLFAATSFTANRATAEPCCYICDVTLASCLNSCGGIYGERTCINECYDYDEECRIAYCSHCPH